MGRASDPTQHKAEKEFEASQRAAARLLQQVAVRLEQFSNRVANPEMGELWITKITLKVDGAFDGGVFAIVNATDGDQEWVAFHGDETLLGCLSGLAARLLNGQLKWREDIPYEQRKGGS